MAADPPPTPRRPRPAETPPAPRRRADEPDRPRRRPAGGADHNPFAAPASDEGGYAGVLSGDKRHVYDVARFQRTILLCILGGFGLFAGMAGLGVVGADGQVGAMLVGTLALALIVAYIGLVVYAAVTVFRLCLRVYGLLGGIVTGLLTFVPLVNLLVLLGVNGRATTILRANGIRVGLLGSDLAAVRRKLRIDDDDDDEDD